MKFDNKTFQQKYEAWKNGAGLCRQVNFSFSKEVLDMVEEELTGYLSNKRKIHNLVI